MKIDTHIHITPPDLIRDWKKIAEREPYFKLLSETPHNRFATYETVADHLEEQGFDKGIVFGFSFQDRGLCQYVNDYTMEAVKAHPEKFIGFMTMPVHDKGFAKEVQRCYKGGLRGIGELFPEGQNLRLEELHLTELKACCLEYNLPLLLHANELVGHDYAGKTKVSQQSIETFIRHHQEIPIILAHFGGGLLFYELMKEIRSSFKNVYYDTAAAVFLYEPTIYKVIREIGILDKVFFGSDYPLLPISRYEEGLNILERKEKGAIMGENALKLFKECQIL